MNGGHPPTSRRRLCKRGGCAPIHWRQHNVASGPPPARRIASQTLAIVRAPSEVEKVPSSRPWADGTPGAKKTCLRVVEKDIVRENAEAFYLPEMHVFLAVVAGTGTKGMRKLVASF
eukprot:2590696-Prymnesium_polylepis.1